jgi:hypothetical protein
MNTANIKNNKIYQQGLSKEIDKNTQAQYLTRKVSKLESKGIVFKTIANRDEVQYSSVVQRFIKSYNFVFNSCFSNDNDICGIVYYSKKDKINLNGSINYDGTVYSKLNMLWVIFKNIFRKQNFPFRFWCRHFALAWATNELDIKNINDLSDLKKSDFLTKFAGKEASLEKILIFYDVYYLANNDIDNETNNLNFSSNNFGEILHEICCDMQQQKDQTRAYLFTTPVYMNATHMMALKIIIKKNVVKIKFYDPNDTLREQNIVFNSSNDVSNLKIKDLLDLKHRIAYGIDNLINSGDDEENCTLQYIPEGYSISQNNFIKDFIAIENLIKNRFMQCEIKIHEMGNEFKKNKDTLEDEFKQYTDEFNASSNALLSDMHKNYESKLDALDDNFKKQISILKKHELDKKLA